MSIQILCHFLICMFVFWLNCKFFRIAWILDPCQMCDMQMLSLVHRLSFHFLDSVLWCTEFLILMKSRVSDCPLLLVWTGYKYISELKCDGVIRKTWDQTLGRHSSEPPRQSATSQVPTSQ